MGLVTQSLNLRSGAETWHFMSPPPNTAQWFQTWKTLPSSESGLTFQVSLNIRSRESCSSHHSLWFFLHAFVFWGCGGCILLPCLLGQMLSVRNLPFFFFFFFNQHRERLKVCGRRPAQSAHCTCVHTRAVTPWNAAPLSFYHLLFVLQPRSVCTLRPSPRRLTMWNGR